MFHETPGDVSVQVASVDSFISKPRSCQHDFPQEMGDTHHKQVENNRFLHENNPRILSMSHPGWLRFRDPYFMVYSKIPI